MLQNTHFEPAERRESSLSFAPAYDFDGLRLPARLGREIAATLEFHEELGEIDWVAPLIRGADVLHIGCDLGLWSARLASHCARLVAYDSRPERAAIARQVLVLNRCRNATATTELDPGDLALAKVIVADLKRPVPHSLVNALLTDRPSQMIILTGWTTSAIGMLLKAGYQHLPQLPRAAVFQRTAIVN